MDYRAQVNDRLINTARWSCSVTYVRTYIRTYARTRSNDIAFNNPLDWIYSECVVTGASGQSDAKVLFLPPLRCRVNEAADCHIVSVPRTRNCSSFIMAVLIRDLKSSVRVKEYTRSPTPDSSTDMIDFVELIPVTPDAIDWIYCRCFRLMETVRPPCSFRSTWKTTRKSDVHMR